MARVNLGIVLFFFLFFFEQVASTMVPRMTRMSVTHRLWMTGMDLWVQAIGLPCNLFCWPGRCA